MQLAELVDKGMLDTKSWVLMKDLDTPLSGLTLNAVKDPFDEGKPARKIRRDKFHDTRKLLLQTLHGSKDYHFREYKYGLGRLVKKALFRSTYKDDIGTPVFFDGVAANFHSMDDNTINIYEMDFSARFATSDTDYVMQLLKDHHKKEHPHNKKKKDKNNTNTLPYGGFGINVIVETDDDHIFMTNRGIYTPRYPNLSSTVSGCIDPRKMLEQNIRDKVKRDLGLDDLTDLYASALIGVKTIISEDTSILTPVLVVNAKTSVEMKEYNRHKGKAEFSPDIESIGFIENYDKDKALQRASGNIFIPSAQAGLYLTLTKKFNNYEKVADALNIDIRQPPA